MSSPRDPFFDELITREITRRRLLRQAGAGTLSLGALSFLAACRGGGLESERPTEQQSGQVAAIPKGEVATEMSFSNWPLYIDVDEESGERPTLQKFRRAFGTRVRYTEEINDNTEFFGKVRPQLARGDSGGRDLFVVTDWLASRMKQLGYVQRLDRTELPNVEANLVDALRAPGFDPQREYAIPWQSGLTGIAYRRDLVGGELESVNDFFDPRFKGKVTMLSEMRDAVGLTMFSLGADPAADGVDRAMEAIEKLEQANRDGQIRRVTGNDYTRDLLKGDAWMSMAWSGDTLQLQSENEDIRFFQPPEGFILWSDNMQIPVGAPHAFTAQKFMNYVYEPEVQAGIAAYVNYVTPVKGVQEILAEDDPALAEEPLIFPREADLERARIFRELPPDEERQLDQAFQRVVGA